MSRPRRRQAARDLAERSQSLRPEQRGVIMSVLLGNALVSLALEVVLLAVSIRAARRAFRVRHAGPRSMAHAALTRPVVALTCVFGVYRVCSRTLLLRWVGQTVRRAEGQAARDEGQRRPS